ncbi:MAG: 50S ribosomal protein L32 [Patescibacteria group bacterium]
MGVPKHRKTHSKTRMGRSHKKLRTSQASVCPNCQQPIRPHRACVACGYYKGKQVIRTKEEVITKRTAKRKAKEEKAKGKK